MRNGIENVYVDVRNGTGADDSIDGGTGNDLIRGLGGNDTADGGTGSDTLEGGDGNDSLSGSDGDDRLDGGIGDDTLDGGRGSDILIGGDGGDVYAIRDVNATIVETTDGGHTDTTVIFIPSYTLADDARVEVLQVARDTVTGVALTGNNLSNTLIGGSGDDTLDGGVGGTNRLEGGAGNDIYYLRNRDDVVFDTAGTNDVAIIYRGNYGSDDEVGQVRQTLGDLGIDDVQVRSGTGDAVNTRPTNLKLTGNWVLEGSDDGFIIATLRGEDPDAGETLTYRIVGSDGALVDNDGRFMIVNNELRLADTTKVDFERSFSHTITLAVTDRAGLTFQRTVAVTVVDSWNEKVQGTVAAERFQGGGGDDTLNGGGGDDTLSGSDGFDVLAGGAGQDRFRFDGGVIVDQFDQIMDFTVGEDVIELSADAFGFEQRGVLDATLFAAGSVTAADQRLVYDPGSGTLSYDPDGDGEMEAALFAVIRDANGNPARLTAQDFFVI